MLEVKGLTKKFGEVTALNDVSFSVDDGEIFGLLGANGAGKTTALRILATMLRATSGGAQVEGHDIVKNAQLVRGKIGLLFGGDTGLYDRLTARENILYFAELNSMDKNEAEERIEELSKIFNFTEFLDKMAGKLSKGTRQKVAFSRTIIHNPSVMFFDEPMLGLDVTSRKEVQDFILHCKTQGKLIILSDHALDIVESLCDRIAILHKGRLLDIGNVQELIGRHECKSLENVFFKLAGELNEQKDMGSSKKGIKRYYKR